MVLIWPDDGPGDAKIIMLAWHAGNTKRLPYGSVSGPHKRLPHPNLYTSPSQKEAEKI
jgi:hypothetical protein